MTEECLLTMIFEGKKGRSHMIAPSSGLSLAVAVMRAKGSSLVDWEHADSCPCLIPVDCSICGLAPKQCDGHKVAGTVEFRRRELHEDGVHVQCLPTAECRQVELRIKAICETNPS